MTRAARSTNEPMRSPRTVDFRRFLQLELIRRCEQNRRYSLRAFARSLGLHHGTLSRVLSGKRAINKKLISRLGEPLRLSPTDADSFLKHLSSQKRPLTSHYRELNLDTFLAVSEWYHDAILEMTHMKSFEGDVK